MPAEVHVVLLFLLLATLAGRSSMKKNLLGQPLPGSAPLETHRLVAGAGRWPHASSAPASAGCKVGFEGVLIRRRLVVLWPSFSELPLAPAQADLLTPSSVGTWPISFLDDWTFRS